MYEKNILSSKEIGLQIKKRRRELKISQEKLAESLGVTYFTIQRYENGFTKLNVETLQKIAFALSVPVIFFFGREWPHLNTAKKTTWIIT